MAPRKWVGLNPPVSITMLMVAIGLLSGCDQPDRPPPSPAPVAKAVPENKAALKDRVVSFCGDCHAYPTADLFPKRNWDAEVRRGFDFYRNSDRKLDPPPIQDVISYYEAAAPDRLPIIPRTPDGPGPMRSLVRSRDRWTTPGRGDRDLACRSRSPHRPESSRYPRVRHGQR